jgi:hypothetical protein
MARRVCPYGLNGELGATSAARAGQFSPAIFPSTGIIPSIDHTERTERLQTPLAAFVITVIVVIAAPAQTDPVKFGLRLHSDQCMGAKPNDIAIV